MSYNPHDNEGAFDGVRLGRCIDGSFRPRAARPRRGFAYAGHARSAAKIAGIMLVIAGAMAGMSRVGTTISYFSDSQQSMGNRLQAGVAAFQAETIAPRLMASMRARMDAPAGGEEAGASETSFSVLINPIEESLPLIYVASARLDPDAPASCGELLLDASFEEYGYTGALKDFAAPPLSTMGAWRFDIAVPASTTIPYEAECGGDIVFRAVPQGAPDAAQHAFHDEKSFRFSVVNEHMPAPIGLSPEDLMIATTTDGKIEPLDATAATTSATTTDADATLAATSSESGGGGGGAGGGGTGGIINPMPAAVTTPDPEPSASTTDEIATSTGSVATSTGPVASSTDPVVGGGDGATATSTPAQATSTPSTAATSTPPVTVPPDPVPSADQGAATSTAPAASVPDPVPPADTSSADMPPAADVPSADAQQPPDQ